MRPVLEWVDAHRGVRDVVVASFDPYAILPAREIGVRTAWITGPEFPLFAAAAAAGQQQLDAVVVHQTALERASYEVTTGLEVASACGVAVWSWGVRPAQVRSFLGLGVSGFCVDDVPAAVGELAAARPAMRTPMNDSAA
jgi:hypothetical protein